MRWNSIFLLALPIYLCGGCGGGAVDVSATRGATTLRLGAGCALRYTGKASSGGPAAADITCPPSLTPFNKNPTFHLSVPLGTKPTAKDSTGEPLQDPHFDMPGYLPGQFVVLSWQEGTTRITCDSQAAAGTVTYAAVPSGRSPSGGDRLTGRFSSTATLSHCSSTEVSMPVALPTPLAPPPVTIGGSFDMEVP